MILSFDIGEKNFAFCLANNDKILLTKCISLFDIVFLDKKQPKSKKTLSNDEILFAMKKIISEINLKPITLILIEKQLATNRKSSNIEAILFTYLSIINELYTYQIIEISSKLKLKNYIISDKPKLTYLGRKKLSKKICNEKYNINASFDECDSLLQIEGFFYQKKKCKFIIPNWIKLLDDKKYY